MVKRIKTKLKCYANAPEGFQLGGWFCGKDTYLWFGIKDNSYASLGGGKLYRLAKAIVGQFEDKKN